MSKRAEELANQFIGHPYDVDESLSITMARDAYQQGYEQAEKDLIVRLKEYVKIGERSMEQEGESQIHAFWDGFQNCAENILRELEEME